MQPQYDTPEALRSFLKLCLDPGHGIKRTPEKLAEVLPEPLVRKAVEFAPHLGTLRHAAQALDEQAKKAQQAYADALAGWIHGEEPEPVRSMPLLQAVAVAYDAAVSHAVGCGTCWPGMRLAEMCPDGQRAAIASLDTVPATAAECTHDEDDEIRTVADQVLRCICGAPVVWASGIVDFGWRHSPDSGRSCQRARPRCQECHMPHALLPGEPPLCRGIREHVTGPAATKATGPQTPLTSPEQRDGVRLEYRARVPRGLVGAALAEAVTAIHREIQQQEGPPARD